MQVTCKILDNICKIKEWGASPRFIKLTLETYLVILNLFNLNKSSIEIHSSSIEGTGNSVTCVVRFYYEGVYMIATQNDYILFEQVPGLVAIINLCVLDEIQFKALYVIDEIEPSTN